MGMGHEGYVQGSSLAFLTAFFFVFSSRLLMQKDWKGRKNV
jgi:hypothetical protein